MTRIEDNSHADIRLRDMLGGRVEANMEDVPDHLLHRHSLLFFMLAAVMMIATDPPGVMDFYPLPVALGFWLIGLFTFIALYVPALLVVSLLQARVLKFAVPVPLLSVVTLVPTLGLTSTVADAIAGAEFPIFTPAKFLPFWLTAQVLETVYSRFVLPQVRLQTAALKARAEGAEPPERRCISVGTHRVPIDCIHHVAAQEHFVRITLDDTSILHRARLRDVVAQTEPGDGIQPHRSWWVSRRAKPRLDRDGTRHVLVLEDDTVVPVARSRLPDIEEWLGEWSG